jgi:hypothetical protein
MNLKEGIEKLKGLIEKFNVEPIATEQSFTEAKLMDGVTIVQYDAEELEQGVPVNVVTPEGILPMPDGNYVMEDGSKLHVMGGLVAVYEKAEELPEGETIAPVAVEEAATPATGEMEVKTAPKRVIKSQVEEHIFSLELEGFEPIKVDFSSMFKALVAENKALKDINKEMFGIVKAISNEPSVAPTEKVNKPFSVKDQRASFKADILRIEKELNK